MGERTPSLCAVIFALATCLGVCAGNKDVAANVGQDVMLSFPEAKSHDTVHFFDASLTQFAAFENGNLQQFRSEKIEFKGNKDRKDFRFMLKDVKLPDGGTYFCSSKDSQDPTDIISGCEVYVFVLGRPSQPVLYTLNPSPAVGNVVVLNCLVNFTSMPGPFRKTFIWRMNDVILPRQTRNAYEIDAVKSSHWGKAFTCQARDDVGPLSEESNPLRLNVLCDQRLNIATKIMAVPGEPLNVSFPIPSIEKNSALDLLSPLCKEMLLLTGTMRSVHLLADYDDVIDRNSIRMTADRVEFTIRNMSASLAGFYSCKIKGSVSSVIPRRCGFKLYVREIPSRPTIVQMPLTEGGELTLRCHTNWTSFPPDDVKLTYTFLLDENERRKYSKIGQFMTLPYQGISFHHVQCCANYGPYRSPLSDVITVYPPAPPAELSVNATSPLAIREGSSVAVAVRCSASCQPGCSPQWSHNGRTVDPSILDDHLYLVNLTTSQSGDYLCSLRDSSEGGPQARPVVLRVYVTVPPSVASFTLNGKVVAKVNEEGNVTFHCVGGGRPKPRVAILSRIGVPLQFEPSRVPWEANATLQDVQCAHNGQFVCVAYGTDGGSITTPQDYKQVSLRVPCIPELSEIERNTVIIEAEIGFPLDVELHIKSYPWVSSIWYHLRPKAASKGGAQTLDQLLQEIQEVSEHVKALDDSQEPKDLLEAVGSTLVQNVTAECHVAKVARSIDNASLSDLGFYYVQVENGLGTQVIFLVVLPAVAPRQPESFSCKKTTRTTLTLSWTPTATAFFPRQTFILMARNLNELRKSHLVFNWTTEVTSETEVVRTLSGLPSATTFNLSLVALNTMGVSKPRFETCVTDPYPVGRLRTPAFVMMGVAATPWTVIVFFLVYSKLRRR